MANSKTVRLVRRGERASVVAAIAAHPPERESRRPFGLRRLGEACRRGTSSRAHTSTPRPAEGLRDWCSHRGRSFPDIGCPLYSTKKGAVPFSGSVDG